MNRTTLTLLLAAPLLLGAVASKRPAGTNTVVAVAPTPNVQPLPLQPSDPTERATAPAPLSNAMSSYVIDWSSINGGGTTNATSTSYQLGASVGQSVAGASSSANYQMEIGFWYGAGSGGCSCLCKYDPECDGVISDVLDVTRTINVAFRGQTSTQDPGCAKERSDVDASGATDVLDVTKVINVAFRGQSVATNYVDPCVP